MSQDDIAAVVTAFGDLAQIVQGADLADKADIYAKLKLTLIYQPTERLVQATIKPGLNMPKGFVSEGGLHQIAHGFSKRSSRCSLTVSSEHRRSGHQVVNGASRGRRRRGRTGCVV
jgi:hypothetical protein